MSNIKTVGDYFRMGKTFVIPNYQRGYKWGVPSSNGTCAVSFLMDCFIQSYITFSKLTDEKEKKEFGYFVQGVTVTERENEIILIDGQQRTTTLFLLLKYLNYSDLEKITIKYDIRKQSHDFLNSLKENTNLLEFCKQNNDETYQDIFYFKKAIRTIDKAFNDKKDIGLEKFTTFLLEKANMLYIKIDEEKATKVFSMMNGNKALMKPEELIKAELLRLIAKTKKKEVTAPSSVEEALTITAETFAKEWDINALRSKYAREWDKWLYWWNDSEVSTFFGSGKTPLGLLIEYFFDIEKQKEEDGKKLKFSFDNFKKLFLTYTKTKNTFAGLRNLQKSFEDLYNDVECYNYLGLALRRNSSKFDVIGYFIDNKNDKEKLKAYAKWVLVGATHKQVIKSSEENEYTLEQKVINVFNNLSEKVVYGVSNDDAALQLLQLNVIADNELGRKFNFEIYSAKSLEHIHSKSFEEKKDNGDWNYPNDKLDFSEDTDISEHCIGNLALLKLNDNSAFNNSPFTKKKDIYFNLKEQKQSLVFLHTISLFTREKWDKEEIKNNKTNFLDKFKEIYGI
jgi:hypothetical protein